jgi:hypothetical protein
MTAATAVRRSMRGWLLAGADERPTQHPGPHAVPMPHRRHRWWKVMCLTGVDYFSTLGYQPGIAALAAGVLSPVATVVLVAVTLFGALPVYRRVARESPRGEGSIAMLERLLTFWKGKLFVLVLLGFAATDFMITMTLSAADATAHVVENPFVGGPLQGHQVLITLILLALLGGIFLKGFAEAIGIAVGLVAVYLTLNAVVVVVALAHVVGHPVVVGDWTAALTGKYSNPLLMIGVALVVFPKLALGLSGFETGVAVMPLVRGADTDTEDAPVGRITGTRKLLTTAALIMSVFLITTSFITTLLIPADEFQPGGSANGRALAYLAHEYLGGAFGSLYDISTIGILWFAGASAMAGLLNLVPRYLPRYGMAPDWARAVRPLTLVFTAIAFLVTWLFDANVDAQGGAYATGVLVLMSSAAIAVTLSSWRRRQRRLTAAFGVISAVFVYTTGANVAERPDGVKIGACFIAGILLVSFVSRLRRSFDLRVTDIELDPLAELFIRDTARREITLIANEPDERDQTDYRRKLEQVVKEHHLPSTHDVVFVEVTVTDPSDFETDLRVHGEVHQDQRILTVCASSVPNALAALALHIRDITHRRPHLYFAWTEGSPVANFIRYLVLGQGEVAPVTREILRRAEPNRTRRPHVHVG